VFALREEMFSALGRPWLNDRKLERAVTGRAVGGKLGVLG
jgi:hypothetical protein